jgi:hypothetical protein
MAIAGAVGIAIGCGIGGYAAHRWFEVDNLKLQAQIDQKKIDDQNATIEALNEASRHSSQLAELERRRADAAESETAQIQKETDDAAAVAAANAAHRPDVCNHTPAELEQLRKRAP